MRLSRENVLQLLDHQQFIKSNCIFRLTNEKAYSFMCLLWFCKIRSHRYIRTLNDKQKHPGCKKVRGRSEVRSIVLLNRYVCATKNFDIMIR